MVVRWVMWITKKFASRAHSALTRSSSLFSESLQRLAMEVTYSAKHTKIYWDARTHSWSRHPSNETSKDFPTNLPNAVDSGRCTNMFLVRMHCAHPFDKESLNMVVSRLLELDFTRTRFPKDSRDMSSASVWEEWLGIRESNSMCRVCSLHNSFS